MALDDNQSRLAQALGVDPLGPVAPVFQRSLLRFEMPILAPFVPNAPDTWFAATQIPTVGPGSFETAVQNILFPGPVRIVGCMGIAKPATPTATPAFNLDDILVQVDIQDNIDVKTKTKNALSMEVPPGQALNKFVPMSSLVLPNRLLMWVIDSPKPELNIVFRARTATVGGAGPASNLGAVAFVALTFLTQPLNPIVPGSSVR